MQNALYNLWHLKKFWASLNGIWDSLNHLISWPTAEPEQANTFFLFIPTTNLTVHINSYDEDDQATGFLEKLYQPNSRPSRVGPSRHMFSNPGVRYVMLTYTWSFIPVEPWPMQQRRHGIPGLPARDITAHGISLDKQSLKFKLTAKFVSNCISE